MNDVEELRQFVVVHARAQNLAPARYRPLLDRIDNDRDGAPGSWVRVWSEAGADLERRGDLLAAARHYGMARFPFVDSAGRQRALDQCVETFDRWRRDQPDIERLEVTVPGGRIRCWATGLSGPARRPLLLVLGGIVSIKEQWAPVLLQARRLGLAGVVTEMPGVGENTVPYQPTSWTLLSAVLDAVADRADVTRTIALALSFSGHLALRCAVEDSRISGVITAGAPVSEFFVDREWQRRLPRVTVDTLAHLSGIPVPRLADALADWALTADQLTSLDIPVCYLVSRRDEIIPAADAHLLRRHVRDLRLIENDDVHASPRHVLESRLWVVLSILRLLGGNPVRRAAMATLLAGLRGRHRFAGR